MADKFADLWDLSAPSTKSRSGPSTTVVSSGQTPGINASSLKRKPQPDVFALLSSAGSSAPNSRPITPATIGHNTTAKPSVSKTSNDAFSGLFADSFGGGSQANTPMTMAERAAIAERTRRERQNQPFQPIQTAVSAWDGLDTFANPPTNTAASRQSKPASKNITRDTLIDDWDDTDTMAKPPSKSNSPSLPEQTILDLDDFVSPVQHLQPPKPFANGAEERFDTLGDFDFGDREDHDSQDDGDDILGMLSKPVETLSKRSSPSIAPTGAVQSHRPRSRPVSPPPHILGQIVEMGFSVEQARLALASTDSGLDLQAALETLLSNGAASEVPDSRIRNTDEHGSLRRPGFSTRSTRDRVERDTPSPSQNDKAKQADKILAQASEIGLQMFSRANAFWSQSKEMLQKAYEERAKPSGPSGSIQSIRPKWMQDDVPPPPDAAFSSGKREGGYSDEMSPVDVQVTIPDPHPQNEQPPPKPVDLLSQEPVVYVPPSRRHRRLPPDTPVDRILESTSSAAPIRPPSPAISIQRRVVSASPSELASSAKNKAIGGDRFKLGQYAEAEVAYTAAIAALPDNHLLLIPLYNNRALTRLKTGDYTGTVEDCNNVINHIGPAYNPNAEMTVKKEEESAGVHFADALIKAWKRRAEAYEGKEKWASAQSDWEAIVGLSWAGDKLRREAIQNASRCRKMVDGRNLHSTAPATIGTRSGSIRGPTRPRSTGPSEARIRYREAQKAAEAEDQARHDLKDIVDAQLISWKGGKETNIRALIASLETVLWSELGWQKVGMAELVTPSQVKVKYTKAIAKLHPDKLTAKNLTLQQKMIANGVFGALNEAWNSFKQ